MNEFPPSSTGQWSIYSVQRLIVDPNPLLGIPALVTLPGFIGAHNYLAIVNPQGEVVEEMQGVPSGKMEVQGASAGDYLLVNNFAPDEYDVDGEITGQTLVTSGNEQQIRTLYNQGYNAVAAALNQNHFLYNGGTIGIGPVTINSNPVWNTASLAMGFTDTQQYNGPDNTPGDAIDHVL